MNNPADSLSLYRFPFDDLQKYGFTEGEVPYGKNEDEIANFPEEVVFSIKDLTLLYKDFATKDETIKDFVEKITELI